MISPDNPQGLPVSDPFDRDPLEQLTLTIGEESPIIDPTPTGSDSSGASLLSIEETPVEDLLLVEGGENID